MNCNQCGHEIGEGMQTCPGCGEAVQVSPVQPNPQPQQPLPFPPYAAYQQQQQQQNAAPYAPQQNWNPQGQPPVYGQPWQQPVNPNDKPTGMWKLLGVLLGLSNWLCALILYFVIKDEKPRTASTFGKFAFLGAGIGAALIFIYIMVMILIFAGIIGSEYSGFEDSFYAMLTHFAG